MKNNIVKITENQLKRIVNESVKKVLKEGGRYSGEYDRTGSPLNDDDYIESVEYVIDSIVNGHRRQAIELVSNMSISDRLELIQYAREVGYLDKVSEILAQL